MSKRKRKRCNRNAKWTVWPSQEDYDGYRNHKQSCAKHLSDTVKNCTEGAYVYADCYGDPCYWRD